MTAEDAIKYLRKSKARTYVQVQLTARQNDVCMFSLVREDVIWNLSEMGSRMEVDARIDHDGDLILTGI